MRLGLGIQPNVVLALECTVCQQLLDFDKQAEDMTCAALFGAKTYAVCSGCLQQVAPSTADDPDYQRRWRVKSFERFGRVVREALA